MKIRRYAAALSSFAIVAAAPMAASAAPGTAGAAVVQVGSLVGIGVTSAEAGPDGSSASAAPVSVNGRPLIPQSGSSGELIGTGTTPVGNAEVAPWSASSTDDAAEAQAAVAHADLLGLIGAGVLRSQSNADWSDSKSRGSASTDGAVVELPGGTTVVLLHTDFASSGDGGSYDAGINDTQVLTTADANGQCAASAENPVDPEAATVLDLNCLAASGGSASVLASIANVAFDGSNGLPDVAESVAGSALTAGASGTDAATAPETPMELGTAPTPQGGINDAAGGPLGSVAATQALADALAATGAHLGTIFLIGLALISVGGAVLATRRPWALLRPPPATAA